MFNVHAFLRPFTGTSNSWGQSKCPQHNERQKVSDLLYFLRQIQSTPVVVFRAECNYHCCSVCDVFLLVDFLCFPRGGNLGNLYLLYWPINTKLGYRSLWSSLAIAIYCTSRNYFSLPYTCFKNLTKFMALTSLVFLSTSNNSYKANCHKLILL